VHLIGAQQIRKLGNPRRSRHCQKGRAPDEGRRQRCLSGEASLGDAMKLCKVPSPALRRRRMREDLLCVKLPMQRLDDIVDCGVIAPST
jgi:hypothetical protein